MHSFAGDIVSADPLDIRLPQRLASVYRENAWDSSSPKIVFCIVFTHILQIWFVLIRVVNPIFYHYLFVRKDKTLESTNLLYVN